MSNTSTRWSSRVSFIFAASAAAIGLGNIWRFPYITGQNGGGAFVLLYLGCAVVLGIPLLIAEIVMGRISRQNPVQALATLAKQSQKSPRWSWLGGLTILAGYLILTYYVVIVGWVIDYFVRASIGQFVQINYTSATLLFQNLKQSHWEMLLTDGLVVFAAWGINILGVKQGLERAVLTMFPALLVLMFLLLGYAMTTGWFDEALVYLFQPDFTKITGTTVLIALGQAFFSLNIAMGVTLMFSAYLPTSVPIISSGIAIAIADTGFAILSGLIIFPIVFAYHLQPSAGPALIFETLPIAFSKMPYGSFIGALFFLMLFFAAFSSVVALLEPSIIWLADTWNISRRRATTLSSTGLWLLSLLAIGSFSAPGKFNVSGITYFKAVDFITASVMLPIGGILIAVFVGWILCKKLISEHLEWNLRDYWYRSWQFVLRFFAPLAILLVLLASFGLI